MNTILEKKFELALGFNRPPLGQFQKVNNTNTFFGMNAALWIGVTGPVIARTGFIIEISQFKQILKKNVIDKYDHHFFDGLCEKEMFLNLIESTKQCFKTCFPSLKLHHIQLITPSGIHYLFNHEEHSIKVKVDLSEKLKLKKSVVIDYEKSNKKLISENVAQLRDYSINKNDKQFPSISEELNWLNSKFDALCIINLNYNNESMDNQRNRVLFSSTSFSGVHQLVNKNMTILESDEIFGKCAALHGHDFSLKVVVKNSGKDTTTELKKVMGLIYSELNGQNYNELPIFKDQVCTCENMLHFIWQFIKKRSKIELQSLRLTETFNNRFIITR